MTDQTENDDLKKTTSTGHDLAEAAYLDRHFEAMRAENIEMLHSVGIQLGWHVLDAGAGGGSFLPFIDEQVGANGQIDAIDLAPENIEVLEKRIASGEFSSQVKAQVGSVTTLPYDDNQFDLVWSANVSQYLTDDELSAMLAESKRVTKPGGLVVIKEFDLLGTRQWGPLDPKILWHVMEASLSIPQVAGVFRPTDLHKWYRKGGYELVKIKSFSGERWQPLGLKEIEYLADLMPIFQDLAVNFDLPEEELLQWQRVIDPAASDYILKDPDFYWREGFIVVTGRVPL